MSSPLTSGRRQRAVTRAAEQEAFSRINKETDERLAKRQQARDEARKIRISEIEKQQREAEKSEDKGYTAHASLTHSHTGLTKNKEAENTDLREKVAEYEDRFRRDMLLYTQLDNEKSALKYEVDLINDDMEELRELYAQSGRENKELTSELKLLKRTIEGLEAEQQNLKHQLRQRDHLIHEAGLVIVEKELDDEAIIATSSNGLTNGISHENEKNVASTSRLLNSAINRSPGDPVTTPLLFAQTTVAMIDKAVPGNQTLDEKVRKLVNTNKAIRTQLEEAETALHTRRSQRFEAERNAIPNGPDYNEMQKDALKQAADIKFKLQECERENANLQGLNMRQESQLKRFKEQTEEQEKEIAELKLINRNVKKELREQECAVDEARETNKHLQNRLEKLRLSRQKL